jgi:butyryl-CoA dehydrogenase
VDLDLTPEQQEFRRTVRDFAERVVAPRVEEADRAEELPMDVVGAMAELGLFGLPFPEAYGGQGGDFLTYCLAVEELARVDSSIAVTLAAAVGLGASCVWLFGTAEQKRRWLEPACRGEILGAFGLTEPGGGSDVSRLRTTARLEDGSWVLDGAKAFTTNAGTALTAFCVVAAVTGQGDGRPETSMILVPTDAEGFEVGPHYRKLGWRASDTHEVVLRGCRVPEGNLLGERGRGIRQFLQVLDGGRIAVAAMSVGLAQACLDASLRYATEREAFGRPIGGFEGVQFKLADMRVQIEAARLLTYRAAWLRDEGRPFATEAAIAKLHASTVAVDCAREAVQIHGGYGFIEESAVARYYRDAKILEIGEGTNEIQRLVVARDLGLPSPV